MLRRECAFLRTQYVEASLIASVDFALDESCSAGVYQCTASCLWENCPCCVVFADGAGAFQIFDINGKGTLAFEAR